MKKLILSFILTLGIGFGVSAQYSAMIFTTDQSEKLTIPVSDLIITIQDDNLLAMSGTQKLEIPLASLASMEFGYNTNTGLDNIAISEGNPIVFYTLDGKKAGAFSTVEMARQALDGGVYIVKLKDGASLKIYIKK